MKQSKTFQVISVLTLKLGAGGWTLTNDVIAIASQLSANFPGSMMVANHSICRVHITENHREFNETDEWDVEVKRREETQLKGVETKTFIATPSVLTNPIIQR